MMKVARSDDATAEISPASARPPERPPEPNWILEALEQTKLLGYGRTVAALVRSPRSFGARWAEGGAEATNPLLLMATSIALLSAWMRVLERALPVGEATEAGSWFGEVIAATAPYAYYAAFAVLAHALLRLLGSERKLRSSVAMGLYVGGSSVTVFTFLTAPVIQIASHLNGSALFTSNTSYYPLMVYAIAMALSFLGPFAMAQAGLHRTSPWKPLALVVAVYVALALTLGAFELQISGAPQVTYWWEGDRTHLRF